MMIADEEEEEQEEVYSQAKMLLENVTEVVSGPVTVEQSGH